MTDSIFQLPVILMIACPVIGFLIQAFLGGPAKKALGEASAKRLMGLIAVVAIAVPFMVTIKAAIDFSGFATPQIVTLGSWIDLNGFQAPFEFLIDPLSLTMMLVITGVGSLIHLYATGYMAKDRDFTRFFTYMNLFVAAMTILVLANNLVLLFVGWEGVGLCSYLLIGFWYKDQSNVKAANKAFIVNRIGDFGFLLGIFLLFALVGANSHRHTRLLSYDVLHSSIQTFHANPGIVTAICLLLFVGACGKSAQFPLYFWLPDAMAGPTPVSALIHAATMVTAGVFLLNRLNFLYVFSPVACAVVAIIGAFTALFAALIAFGQTDIKKVLAFSTVSQLGFMFVACGSGGFSAGIFHVVTHAFFKALLFLGAGAVIYAMAHNQDMRNYGKLAKYLPITFICMFIAFLAISGIPPFAGYYSKEAIIGSAIGGQFARIVGINLGVISGYVALFAAMLTGIYMARLTWLTFLGKKERWREIEAGHHHELASEPTLPQTIEDGFSFFMTEAKLPEEEEHEELDANHTPHEVPLSMSLPLIVLAVASSVGGYLLNGKLRPWLDGAGLGIPFHEVSWVTPAGITAAVLGVVIGALVYFNGLPQREGWDMSKWNPVRRWALGQFGYDQVVTEGGSQTGRDLGAFLRDQFETWIVDGAVGGLAIVASQVGQLLRKGQKGFARVYAAVILCGVLGLVGWIFLLARGGF